MSDDSATVRSPFEPETLPAVEAPTLDPGAVGEHGLSIAALVLLVAVIALFWGWRLMLALTMLSLTAIIVVAGHRVLSERLPWSVPLWLQLFCGVIAIGIVWTYLRPVHRLMAALYFFCLLAAVVALPGILLDWWLLTLIGGLLGGALGFWLGWRLIHQVDAIVSACFGGLLLIIGGLLGAEAVAVDIGWRWWVGMLLSVAVLVPLGVIVQLKQLRRQMNADRQRARGAIVDGRKEFSSACD